MSEAFEAGKEAAQSTVVRFMELAGPTTTQWQQDSAFLFMMGIRAHRDGYGGMEESREFFEGALEAINALEDRQ